MSKNKNVEVEFRKLGGKLSDLCLPGAMVLAEVLQIEEINGIYLAADALNADYRVAKTGPGYIGEDGEIVRQCFAKKGDYITVDMGRGHFNVEIDGKQYILVSDANIAAKTLEPAGVI